MKISTVLAFILMILIISIFYLIGLSSDYSGMIQGELPSNSALKITLSVIAMLLGIIAGSLHRIWRTRKGPLSMAALRVGLKSADLWRSFLAAPLIYSGVYTAAQAQPDFVLAFVFSFQTGFFAETIIQVKESELKT